MALEIEFVNNGILDSLTGSPAQSVFLKQLKQAVSRANRSGQALCIVTLRLSNNFAKSNSSETSGKAFDLIAISQILKGSIRGGDFYTRMSQLGFWVCLQGDLAEAEVAIKRFQDRLEDLKRDELKSGIACEIYERRESVSVASWIDEIDKSYF
jgi:GGDEF domain-containing protein